MKAHIQYLRHDGSDLCGSDGILPLDGRLTYASACDNAHVQAWRLRKVRSDIGGFQVYRGGIRGRVAVNAPTRFPATGPDGSRVWHG
jgi:hypothetical protein